MTRRWIIDAFEIRRGMHIRHRYPAGLVRRRVAEDRRQGEDPGRRPTVTFLLLWPTITGSSDQAFAPTQAALAHDHGNGIANGRPVASGGFVALKRRRHTGPAFGDHRQHLGGRRVHGPRAAPRIGGFAGAARAASGATGRGPSAGSAASTGRRRLFGAVGRAATERRGSNERAKAQCPAARGGELQELPEVDCPAPHAGESSGRRLAPARTRATSEPQLSGLHGAARVLLKSCAGWR